MTSTLIAIHVIVALIFLGPVTVAVSTFQSQALKAHSGDRRAEGAASVLHRMTRVYGLLSALVPLLGIAVMFTNPGVFWADSRFHLSILLALVAWLLLLLVIIPKQRKLISALGLAEGQDSARTDKSAGVDFKKAKGQLSMFGGIFNLLWIVTAIVMFLPSNFGL